MYELCTPAAASSPSPSAHSISRFADIVTLASSTLAKPRGADRGFASCSPVATLAVGTAPINSRHAPAEAGIFGRLLRRGRSTIQRQKTGGNRAADYGTYVAIHGPNDPHQKEDGSQTGYEVLPGSTDRYGDLIHSGVPITHARRAGSPSSPQQRPNTASAAEPPPAESPNIGRLNPTSSMPPPLKKKASFRERFRLSVPPSLSLQHRRPEPPQPERKPTPAYVPKHAAADFSRMVVSPRNHDSFSRRVGGGYDPGPTYRQTLEPISADLGEEDEDKLTNSTADGRAGWRSGAAVAQQPRAAVAPERSHDQVGDSSVATEADTTCGISEGAHQQLRRQEQQLMSARPCQGYERHSYTLRPDPLDREAENPLSKNAQAATVDPAPPSFSARLHKDGQQFIPSHDHGNDRETEERSSDFDLFLKRAEEEDQALRQKYFRRLNDARSGAIPPQLIMQQHAHQQSPWTSPLDGIEEVQGDFSTGTTAVNPQSSSRSRSRRDSGQFGVLQSQPRYSGEQRPAKRSSWAASSSRGHASAAPALAAPGGGSDGEEKPAGRRHTVESYDGAYMVGGGGLVASSPRTAQFPQTKPRTLRRQGSITQRIAEYIRPPRDSAAHHDADLMFRPRSRAQARLH